MSDRPFLVDERTGSKDLLGALQRMGVPAELAHLEFGDFQFMGRGIDDTDVPIAVELKRTTARWSREKHEQTGTDLISSMYSTRFAGRQLGGLQGFTRAWLLTEGIWRCTPEGIFEVLANHEWHQITIGRSPVKMADVESWILTQVIRGGLSYWHAATRADVVRFLSVLFHWWTDKTLAEHRSNQAIYLPPPDRALFVEPSTFVKMASCLPSVGYEKAFALESEGFKFRLVNPDDTPATPKDLTRVDGIGKTIASKITESLR